MDVAEIIVVLNLAVSATEPALVEDVFQQREPEGEYLFHVATNESAVVDVKPSAGSVMANLFGRKGRKAQQVLNNDYDLLHEASVVFDENKITIVRGYIEQGARLINTGNLQSMDKEYDLLSGDLDEAYSSLGHHPTVHMQISSGDDFTSYVSFEFGADGPVQFAFEYWGITDDRTLRIASICSNTDSKIGDVYEYWNKMVNTYSNMPMNRFSGASNY